MKTHTTDAMITTVVSACLGLLPLNGADITWKGGDSTSPYDLATPANWNGGSLPTSSDTVKLNASPDQPLTLSAESLTVNQIYILGNTIDFDLGKDHAFYANAKVFFGNNNVDQVVTLKSGILGIYPDTSGDGRVFISDSYTGSRLVIVDGEDSIFQGCKKSTIILGQNQPNNTLIVRNGALLRGGINMGLNSAAAINNRVVITGLGSRYELPSGYTAGCTVGGGLGNRGNEFMVTNRATFTIANGTTLNLGTYYTGSDTGSGTLTFADHATGTVNNDVYVGQFGSTNRLNVLSGSSFACSSHLNIGGCRADKVKDGRVSIDNEVRVAGEGSKLTVGGQLYIGRGAGSTDSRLIVENGATFVATNEALHIGYYGSATNSLLAVRSGATFIGGNGYIYIAENPGSANSKLVVDDATFIFTNQELRARSAYVGLNADNSELIVTN